MTAHADQSALETMAKFRECYSTGTESIESRIEREVIGFPGATGYTTFEQVDDLTNALRLPRRARILDVGSGAGWPALPVASATAAHTVLTDLVSEGVTRALRCPGCADWRTAPAVAVASGAALPFKARSFDAVTHADVLCCVGSKLRMLTASRRVLKPGGRTAFFTIHVAPALSPSARRDFARSRSFHAYSPSPVTDLLATAGFADIEERDVTPAYLHTACAWYEAWTRHETEARALLGSVKFDEQQAYRLESIRGIEGGFLKRSLFSAMRPHPRIPFAIPSTDPPCGDPPDDGADRPLQSAC